MAALAASRRGAPLLRRRKRDLPVLLSRIVS
jgi:hypothetical protein